VTYFTAPNSLSIKLGMNRHF